MRALLAIVGPTATGKSALAMSLAERLEGEIVNADALQVYRGFDIGTAKPTPEDRQRIPHHLIDILEPAETYSAGGFARRAEEAIAEIHDRDRSALVVGGSGLYLRALLDGMSHIPETDPEIRAELRAQLGDAGLEVLRERLAEVDPAAYERLQANDSQRILRALEVVLSTGRTLDSWTSSQPFGRRSLEALRIGLTLPRAILYDRIERRVGRMVDAGWVEEVAGLLERGVAITDPAFQAIGYRQLARHLAGEWSLEEAVSRTVRATRQFAKRQETWNRRETRLTSFSAESEDELWQRVWVHLQTGLPQPDHLNAGEES